VDVVVHDVASDDRPGVRDMHDAAVLGVARADADDPDRTPFQGEAVPVSEFRQRDVRGDLPGVMNCSRKRTYVSSQVADG
jgi:hypothetical protein